MKVKIITMKQKKSVALRGEMPSLMACESSTQIWETVGRTSRILPMQQYRMTLRGDPMLFRFSQPYGDGFDLGVEFQRVVSHFSSPA